MLTFRDLCHKLFNEHGWTTAMIVRLTGLRKWEVQYARSKAPKYAKFAPENWHGVMAAALDAEARELLALAAQLREEAIGAPPSERPPRRASKRRPDGGAD